MKFSKYLESHLQHIWRAKYINYKMLKKVIKRGAIVDLDFESEAEKTPLLRKTLSTNFVCDLSNCILEELKEDSLNEDDQHFFDLLHHEICVINGHYIDKLNSYTTAYSELKEETDEIIISNPTKLANVKTKSVNDMRHEHSLEQLRQSYREIYKQMIFLQEFQKLNVTGVLKILKKFDKSRGSTYKERLMKVIQKKEFANQEEMSGTIEDIENNFSRSFFDGNSEMAMKKLIPKKMSVYRKSLRWKIFRIGLYFGITLAILLHLVDRLVFRGNVAYYFDSKMYPFFRAIGAPLALAFFAAINVHIWKGKNINHAYIFEIERVKLIDPLDILEIVGVLATIWSVCLLFYGCRKFSEEGAQYIPLFIALLIVTIMSNPFNFFFRDTRFWLIKSSTKALISPLVAVRFADFFIADQFISLSGPINDWEHLICHYTMNWSVLGGDVKEHFDCLKPQRPMRIAVAILPAWIRFAQCMRRLYDTGSPYPHLVNAGKYSFAIMCTLLYSIYCYELSVENERKINITVGLFIAASIISTVYAITYDLLFDWGLRQRHKNDSKLFSTYIWPRWVYILAAIFDTVVRCFWGLKLISQNVVSDFWFQSILMGFEILRRAAWNVFRVEHEYINENLSFHSILFKDSVGIKGEETYVYSRQKKSKITSIKNTFSSAQDPV